MVLGKVEKITSNTAGFFNIKVNGAWYGAGKKSPQCSEGDFVKFEEQSKEVGDREYLNVVPGTLEVTTPPKTAVAVTPAPASAVTKDDYWTNKEARDIKVQKKIEFQAARNTAVAAATALLAANVIPGTKGADKMELFLSLVDELTLRYNADTEHFVTSGSLKRLVETEAVEDQGVDND